MKIIPSVIGLGYVGLPTFLKLQKKLKTIGFDTDKSRIKNLIKKRYKQKFSRKNLILKKGSLFTFDLKN